MSIPTYQEVMFPMLYIMKDKKEYSINQLILAVSEHFNLTEDEKIERLKSGKATVIRDRVSWAIKFIKHANLIERTDRGIYKITQSGLDELINSHEKIDVKYLHKFPTFVEWYSKNNKKKYSADDTRSSTKLENYESELEKDNLSNKTPTGLIEKGRADIENELNVDLLERIKSMSYQGFEKLVLELFKKMGYGDDIKHTGKSGDHGIDGIIGQDKLGLEKIYIQAKKWNSTVNESELQKFVGALNTKSTQKGIFITLSNFNSSAKEYIDKAHTNVILIDGTKLTKLLIQYNVGISILDTIKLKKIDENYFEELDI